MIYPIEFPAKAITNERLGLQRRQTNSESPWTYEVQTTHTASQWVLEWSWSQMPFATAEVISAWLLSLKGVVGTFRYYPRQSKTSILTGRTLVLPGYAYNESVKIGGWSAGEASGLRLGQFCQIGDQLLRITSAAAFADGSGQVTIEFSPELRKDYASGTLVNFANPSGVFRLATSDALTYTLNPDKLPEFGTISAREAV